MRAVSVAGASLCAVLYAVGSFATAYIQSPWGFGQFRPAVVIPAVFAAVFGPWPAGVGAAVGTLIADSVKHGSLYLPSITAAVPGNFIGFYILGRLVYGRFSWRRFILSSVLMLVVANLVVAFLYTPTIYLLGFLPKTLEARSLILFSLALTVWWFATMLPFMLFLTPPLIRAVSHAAPSMVPEDVRASSFGGEERRLLSLSLILPGAFLTTLGVLIAATPLGGLVLDGLTVKLKPGFAALSLEAMKTLLIVSGLGLALFGLVVEARRRLKG